MIKKKDIDLRSLTEKAVLKTYFENKIIQKKIINEQENQIEFDINDLIPKLEITTNIYTNNNKPTYNELQYKELFEKFCGNDLETAYIKINNALGIYIDESSVKLKSSTFKVTPSQKDQSTLSKADQFASLGIYKTLIHIFDQEPTSAGTFFESFIAGLANKYRIGQFGGAEDIEGLGSLKLIVPSGSPVKSSFKNTVNHLLNNKDLNFLITLRDVSTSDITNIGSFKFTLNLKNFIIFLSITSDYKNSINDKNSEQFYSIFFNHYYGESDGPTKLQDFKNKNPQININIETLFSYLKNNQVEENLREATKSSPGQYMIGAAANLVFTAASNAELFNYKFLGGTSISKKNIEVLFARCSSQLNSDLENLLKPLFTAYLQTNRYISTNDMSFIRSADANAKIFSSNVSALEKTKVTESVLNLTEEAAIVMEMLKRMEG